MQASDYMYMDNKKYTLIDIEHGKQIITCANFELELDEDEHRRVLCSSCWRGYTAKYWVEDSKLFGEKTIEVWKEGNEDGSEVWNARSIVSPRVFIPYTGSCIIAYGDQNKFDWAEEWKVLNSDFLDVFTITLEAYELYFEYGTLVEKLSLERAIVEAKDSLLPVREYIDGSEEYYKAVGKNAATRERIAHKYTKYEYSTSSYKWRDRGSG